MGNGAVTKAARKAAREAAVAVQEELRQRTRANVADLATFFSARERAEAVDGWLAERQKALGEQAAQRRSEQRGQCGRALRAMRDRGEPLREIARLAGIAEKTVRELIRDAEAAPAGRGPLAVVSPAAVPVDAPTPGGGPTEDGKAGSSRPSASAQASPVAPARVGGGGEDVCRER